MSDSIVILDKKDIKVSGGNSENLSKKSHDDCSLSVTIPSDKVSRKRNLSSEDKEVSDIKRSSTVGADCSITDMYDSDETESEIASNMDTSGPVQEENGVSDLLGSRPGPRTVERITSDPSHASTITLELIFSKLQLMDSKLDRLDPLEVMVKELINDSKDLRSSLECTQGELRTRSEELLELKEEVARSQMENSHLNSQLTQLRRAHQDLEDRVIKQETYSRRENVLVHGIAETTNTTDVEMCGQIVAKLFVDMKVGPFNLSRCHRLGQRKWQTATNPHPRPRPIIIRFSQYSDKAAVMKSSHLLNAKQIYFSDDYPQEIQERRLKLKPVLKLAKKVDTNAKLVYDKIVFQKKLYSVDNIQSIPLDLQGIGTKVTDTHVFFKGRYAPLSNLYNCQLHVDGHSFHSSEQLFQFKKAVATGCSDIVDKVLATNDAFDAMILGKKIQTDEEWAATTGTDLMGEALKVKFDQVPAFRDFILEHGDKAFVESSANKIWGSGIDFYSDDASEPSKWTGKNLLGQTIKKLAN